MIIAAWPLFSWKKSDSARPGTPKRGGDRPEPLAPFALSYFECLTRLLKSLGVTDHGNADDPPTKPTWGDLFSLELEVIKKLDGDDLVREAPLLRERLRDVLGDREYAATVGSILPTTHDEKKLKSELEFLIREIYRRYSLTDGRTEYRNRILLRVLGILVIWIMILLVSFYGCSHWIPKTDIAVRVGLFVLVPMVVGSLGGYLSLLSRVQSLPYSGDPLFRMLTVWKGWLAVYAAPVAGSLLAALGVVFFATDLLQGKLFPDFEGDFTLKKGEMGFEYSKLLLWSFIIGFSERYVPDALNRIIQSRRDQVVEMFGPGVASDKTGASSTSSMEETDGDGRKKKDG